MLVVVQSTPERRENRKKTLESLEASDVGKNYVLAENLPGVSSREHFLTVLWLMADSHEEFSVRLEDDVIVNQHLVHNVQTWPALRDPRFGAGWLFFPYLKTPRSFVHPIREHRDQWGRHREMHASLGVVLLTRDIPEIIDRCALWFGEHTTPNEQDLAMSNAVYVMGRRLCFHGPSLVENRCIPSTLGHGDQPIAGPWFSETWRR